MKIDVKFLYKFTIYSIWNFCVNTKIVRKSYTNLEKYIFILWKLKDSLKLKFYEQFFKFKFYKNYFKLKFYEKLFY